MNHGLKLLIGCFVFGTIVCICGCLWDNTHTSNKNWIPYYVTEIHAHRPIEDVVSEIERDNESQRERIEREAEERDQDTDFGRMS